MTSKRSRAAFEADLQAQQSPFVAYGTPLPPLDPDVRDDGSYMPVWKQEVTDERGRKRLHGAFTGGFSAGYFNTVGSKEGWAPSAFVSSRSNRHKNEQKSEQQRAEDYMDEEDLADAAEAQSLQTQQSYSGLGSTNDDEKRTGLFMDLLKPQGDTMGVKLLRKMGWRDGQGVGPKVKRKARLDGYENIPGGSQETHLFAPENSQMVRFHRKHDRKGLGFGGESKLDQGSDSRRRPSHPAESDSGDDQGDVIRPSPLSVQRSRKQNVQKYSGGFGLGVLNDHDDEDDDYTMGPRISYNRTVGGEKKTKKKVQKPTLNPSSANPLLKTKPVFRSKRALESRSGSRNCHDGRLPLEGFLLSDSSESPALLDEFQGKHNIPQIPEGWKSTRAASAHSQDATTFQSTADAAKASTLDPKSRAAVLGESQLPGKSVFDFLSPAARDRLAAASGRSNLPNALGENIPGDETRKDTETKASSAIPQLDRNVALAALGRGEGGWMPYADDGEKRSRYKAFLELHAAKRSELPRRPASMKQDTWTQELQEFAHAAEVFKPMSGSMASRFASSSTLPGSQTDAVTQAGSLQHASKLQTPEDPAVSAAKMGMFGSMTRSEHRFYPTRLLCKRFNVKPPLHAESEPTAASQGGGTAAARHAQTKPRAPSNDSYVPTCEAMPSSQQPDLAKESFPSPQTSIHALSSKSIGDGVLDTSHNEALEGHRAGDDLFKAVFGDGDDEGN